MFDLKLFRIVILSGFLVGTLDIGAAFIQAAINGGTPIRVLQFIASGIFDRDAFQDGYYALWGLGFHYFIATSWTSLFFYLYPRVKPLSKNKLLTGISYGTFVWFMMTQIVLPLSNTPKIPFKVLNAVIAISILIVAIALPLTYIASRFYKEKK